jgi:hypothetical protein
VGARSARVAAGARPLFGGHRGYHRGNLSHMAMMELMAEHHRWSLAIASGSLAVRQTTALMRTSVAPPMARDHATDLRWL